MAVPGFQASLRKRLNSGYILLFGKSLQEL
jgi:hypothetical protein